METKRKQRYLHLYQTDINKKSVIRDRCLYIDYKVNKIKEYNICKYLCTQRGTQQITDLKGEIDSNTVIVEDFNSPQSIMDG